MKKVYKMVPIRCHNPLGIFIKIASNDYFEYVRNRFETELPDNEEA